MARHCAGHFPNDISLNPQQPYKEGIIISILQVRRLQHREMKRFAQRHQTYRPVTEARLKLRSLEPQGHTLVVNHGFSETSPPSCWLQGSHRRP